MTKKKLISIISIVTMSLSMFAFTGCDTKNKLEKVSITATDTSLQCNTKTASFEDSTYFNIPEMNSSNKEKSLKDKYLVSVDLIEQFLNKIEKDSNGAVTIHYGGKYSPAQSYKERYENTPDTISKFDGIAFSMQIKGDKEDHFMGFKLSDMASKDNKWYVSAPALLQGLKIPYEIKDESSGRRDLNILRLNVSNDWTKLDLTTYGVTYQCDYEYVNEKISEKDPDKFAEYVYDRDLGLFLSRLENKTKNTTEWIHRGEGICGLNSSSSDSTIYTYNVTVFRNEKKIGEILLNNNDFKHGDNGVWLPVGSLKKLGFEVIRTYQN